MDLYTELLALIDALAEKGIDYAICGGLAVALHGYPRFTKDIDILAREDDLEGMRSIAKQLGYTFDSGILPFGTGGPYERRINRLTKIVDRDALTLDILLVNPVLEDVWLDRDFFQWRGRAIQVASAPGLAKMKRMAGRPQDLLDLNMLGFEEEDDGEA